MPSLAGVLGGATGGGLPPLVQEVLGDVSDFTKKMDEVKNKAESTHNSTSSSFNKLAGAGKAAFLTLAAAGGAFVADSIKNALKGQQAHALMTQAIKNAGANVEDMSKKVEALVPRFEKLGFTNDELEQGIARLTQMTGSGTKALQDIGLAADIARARHMGLEESATLLGKAEMGNAKAFKQFGIDVKDANGNTKATSELMRELKLRVDGTADAMSKTLPGKIAALRAEFDNLTERVGNWLIPKLTAVAGAVANTVRWFEQHKDAALALGAAIGALATAAMGAYLLSLMKAVAGGGALEGNIGGLIKVVMSLGSAVTGTSGAMSLLSGAGILAGVGLLAYGIKKLSEVGKISDEQIHHLAASVVDFSHGTISANDLLKKMGTNFDSLNQAVHRQHGGLQDLTESMGPGAIGATKLSGSLTTLDRTLADAVKNNNAGAAAELITQLASASDMSVDAYIKGAGGLKLYTKALGGHADAAKISAEATKEQGGAEEEALTPTEQLTKAVDNQVSGYTNLKSAVDEWQKMLEGTFDASIKEQAAQDSLTEARQKLAESVKKNGPVFQGDTAAALENRAALRDVETKSKDLSAALSENSNITGGAVSAQANLTAQLQQVAKTVPGTQGAIDALTSKMNGLTSTDPALNAWFGNQLQRLNAMNLDADQAAGALGRLQQAANNLAAGTDYIDPAGHLHRTNPGMLGRASGGPVNAGQPYIVGEHRPELFVPSQSGYIVPKVPSSSSTITVSPGAVVVTVNGGDASASRIEAAVGAALEKFLQSAVAVGRSRPAYA